MTKKNTKESDNSITLIPSVERTVDFYGDKIICFTNLVGEVSVAIQPMCTSIGISSQMQIKKLKEDSKFTTYDNILSDSRGRNHIMVCLALGHLEGWLFSINPNKVKPSVKETLIRYQQECIKVLHNYWKNGIVQHPDYTVTQQPLIEGDRTDRLEQKIDHIEQMLATQQANHQSEMIDLESRLRAEHTRRLVDIFTPWAKSENLSQQIWGLDQLKKHVADELNPFTYFKLYELFLEIYRDITKEEAQTLAGKFNKLDSVKAFARGHATEQYGDRVYRVVRYERKDWDELRELAITWLREHKYIKQRTLFA